MSSVVKSAKTAEKAIELALQELDILREEAEIEILEAGSNGFFGIGAKDAVVKVSEKFTPDIKAKEFLNDIFSNMGMDVNVNITLADRTMHIDLSGENMGLIIGKRGDTLDALEHLVSLCVNKGDGDYIKVVLDTEHYREKRRQTLIKLADSLAASVVRSKRRIVLEPMSSNERRIIHATLQGNKYVDTYSVGDEPNRKVVVALKKMK